MDKIHVKFEFEGKTYAGFFTNVHGGGSTAIFHLSVNDFYWGRLRYSDVTDSWCFDQTPKTKGLEKLADEFGELIMLWYQ